MNDRKITITFTDTDKRIDIDQIAHAIANTLTERERNNNDKRETISRITDAITTGNQARKKAVKN